MGCSFGRPLLGDPGRIYGRHRRPSRPLGARIAIAASIISDATGNVTPRAVIAPALSCGVVRTTRLAPCRHLGTAVEVVIGARTCTTRAARRPVMGAFRVVSRIAAVAVALAAIGAAFGDVPSPRPIFSTLGRRPIGATGRIARALVRPIARRPCRRARGRRGVVAPAVPVSTTVAYGRAI